MLTEASVARHELRIEEARSAPERRNDEPDRPTVGGAEPGGAGEVAQAASIEYETCFLRERGLASEEAGEPCSLVGGVEGGVDAAGPVGAAAGASGTKGVVNGSAVAGTSAAALGESRLAASSLSLASMEGRLASVDGAFAATGASAAARSTGAAASTSSGVTSAGESRLAASCLSLASMEGRLDNVDGGSPPPPAVRVGDGVGSWSSRARLLRRLIPSAGDWAPPPPEDRGW